MKIEKVWIRETNIPIKKGTVRWEYYGEVMTIEVELDVHPTIVNFLNCSGFVKERVRIVSDNQIEMEGKFSIHTAKSGILLTADLNEVAGAENFTPTTCRSDDLLPHPVEEDSLGNRFKANQISILITFLTSLLESEAIDQGNREFIYTLVEKLKDGQHLSSFDKFLLDEIRYLLEETIDDSQHLSPYFYMV